MGGSLPAGAQIPVTFQPGEALTAEALTSVQTQLLAAILTHSHAGNGQPAPQGVQIAASGIADGAVGPEQIHEDAVQRRHLAASAVGGNEIAEHVVGANHLKRDAVLTDWIKNQNVTLEKLSADVVALLTAPRTGATTYGYCAYLSGDVVFPPKPGGHWWDWLLQSKEPVRIHDLPVMRRRDDGGWQPVESIMPPSDLAAGKMAPVVAERERIAMTVNPAAVNWETGVEGVTSFHPGIGGNAVFSEDGQPVKFQLRKAPSPEERLRAEQIFYNCGIELEQPDMAALLRIAKIYDFLNNPQLLPVGYWTGQSQNVKAVYRTRMAKSGGPIIRIKFITPYIDGGYVVCLTPEMNDRMEVAPTPVVLRRRPDYVDVGFRYGESFMDKVNFNLAIHGELAES